MDPYIGEIKLVPYNFAPLGWALCNGALLAISQNEALFALIGTMYGGDGQSTFQLPDLRGRVALHLGQGAGLSNYAQGEVAGAPATTLTAAQIPAHTHAVAVSSALGNLPNPSGQHLGAAPLGLGYAYGTTSNGTMPAGAIASTGGSQPHSNEQPYLGLNYIIALEGVFPSE